MQRFTKGEKSKAKKKNKRNHPFANELNLLSDRRWFCYSMEVLLLVLLFGAVMAVHTKIARK